MSVDAWLYLLAVVGFALIFVYYGAKDAHRYGKRSRRRNRS